MTEDNNSFPINVRKSGFFYGYIIIAIAVCIQIVIWGLYSTYGIFFNSLLDHFGWSRAIISGAVSLSHILIGLGAIALGDLNDRFGPRVIMATSGIILGTGFILMARVDAIWQLYLFYGLMVGFGTSGTDVVLLSTTARWFVKKRGLMSGVVKVGTGIGIMIMPVVVNGLISTHGWRNAFLIAGVILLVFVVLAAQFLRRDPAKMHQFPDGSSGKADYNESPIEVGLSLRQAVATPQLWMLCLTYLVIYLCGDSILVHIAPHAIDMGISIALAATIISTFGGASIIGRLAMGFTSDRVGNKFTLIICFLVAIAGLVWLQFAGGLWPLYLFSAIYGFSHGGFFTLISPIVAELFGTRSHGVILGIVIFSGSLGGAIGLLLSGYIFDITGSYSIAFLLWLSMLVIGAIITVLLRPTILDRTQPTV